MLEDSGPFPKACRDYMLLSTVIRLSLAFVSLDSRHYCSHFGLQINQVADLEFGIFLAAVDSWDSAMSILSQIRSAALVFIMTLVFSIATYGTRGAGNRYSAYTRNA
jgi:tetrahydromethanopterin S-methyltransferase subunit E